ncbi:MAG: hypothetical protein WB713_05085 [Methyloceanibacter sp.]|jgi:hypothetical protein
MTSYQRKYEHLAGVCDALAQSASTPEQRESFLDLANKWRAMANSQKLYEVAPRDAHRYTVTAWLKGLQR